MTLSLEKTIDKLYQESLKNPLHNSLSKFLENPLKTLLEKPRVYHFRCPKPDSPSTLSTTKYTVNKPVPKLTVLLIIIFSFYSFLQPHPLTIKSPRHYSRSNQSLLLMLFPKLDTQWISTLEWRQDTVLPPFGTTVISTIRKKMFLPVPNWTIKYTKLTKLNFRSKNYLVQRSSSK